MWRPQVSPDVARRNRVVTMVTDAEFETLQNLAKNEGESISSCVHDILVSSSKFNS